MNLGLVGYGRMGRAVREAALERGHRIVWIVDPGARGSGIRRRLAGTDLAKAEVAVEFTVPAAAEANVVALLRAGIPTVCGTTGWNHGSRPVRAAAREGGTGAVIAANFSPGMNLLYRLVREAAALLGASGLYDPYVFESHHRGKADAPSGTALRLADLVSEADPRHPRPRTGPLDGAIGVGEMHVSSIRAGADPGRHTVGFEGAHDAISLTHRSRSRSALALGAILAAEWVRGRKGIHGFDRVLDDLAAGSGARKGGTR